MIDIMIGKRLLLTLNPRIHKELERIAGNNLMTVQQYISEILRKKVLELKNKK
ncbi:MAG: hypothetical protein KAT77_00805 [Nanoarchaeota archaeon]|nr:hypothetical protein [Nanoarchaeota archaeon]